MGIRSLTDASVVNQRVLVRVDYNVSLGRTLKVVDDTRLVHTLPTLEYLRTHKASQITLLAHLGKPGGQVVPELSLRPVAEHLAELLGVPVTFCESFAHAQADHSPLRLLENLRFDPREESGDAQYAQMLASLGDLYVNEAFGESHRNATSITGIPQYLPSYAGFGLISEFTTLTRATTAPDRPLVVLVGGAKVASKIGLLRVLQQKADYLLLGGGMANTFLLAQGHSLGASLVEPDQVAVANSLLSQTQLGGAKIMLPVDLVVGQKDSALPGIIVPVTAVPVDAGAYDIGPATVALFSQIIAQSKTVIWNGPMGLFEDARFVNGTEEVYRALTANEPAFVIVGGGDTLTAITHHTQLSRLDFISTGGGAMLELIEKGTLPGIQSVSTL